MYKVALLGAASAMAQYTPLDEKFTDSAKFERWSHFKDYGVPAVMGKDALNSAAIADGTCRLTQQMFDGFFFWHYPRRVERVLQALKDAPPTSKPSFFVLSAEHALLDACSDKNDEAVRPEYTLDSLAGSVQNWYHALAAPPSDPSWKGQFDPAYQRQQVALTAGFICIVACDLNDGEITESHMRGLQTHEYIRRTLNATYPWVASNTVFSGARSTKDLAMILKPLLTACWCTKPPSATTGKSMIMADAVV